jgi:hypothetical protein
MLHHRLQDLRHPDPLLGAGQDDGVGVHAQELHQLLPSPLRLGPGEVDLVQDGDDLEPGIQRQEEVGEGLGLDSLARVHHQEGPLAGRQGPGHLVGEVHVTRRVDEVQLIELPVGRPVVHVDGMELDRDPPLPLQLVGVQDLVPHGPLVQGTGGLQEAVRQRGLPVVDVGHDAEVPDVLDAHGIRG